MGLGRGSKTWSPGPETGGAIWLARARNPRREQEWRGAAREDAGVDAAEGGCGGLGGGLGLRVLRMESPRVC